MRFRNSTAIKESIPDRRKLTVAEVVTRVSSPLQVPPEINALAGLTALPQKLRI